MARRRRPSNVQELIRDIDSRLALFVDVTQEIPLRRKVQWLCEIREREKDLAVSILVERGWNVRSAKERILLYLKEHVGVPVEGVEIDIVSGISDYPRRVRELRVEEGYQISTGASSDSSSGINLRPDQYMLVSVTPDPEAARRWHVANRIRRSGKGSREQVREFLMENVGSVVTTDELAYVAKNAKEFSRRVRELRTEDGYAISTRFTGRPDLAMGQYVLESVDRVAEPHDRMIPEAIQREVYDRDRNTCRICGWDRSKWSPEDARILELHHLMEHRSGGQNISQNLIVLCSRCHDQVHAGKHDKELRRLIHALMTN